MDIMERENLVTHLLDKKEELRFRKFLPGGKLAERRIKPVIAMGKTMYRDRKIIYKGRKNPIEDFYMTFSKKQHVELENIEMPGLDETTIRPMLDFLIKSGYIYMEGK